MKKSPQKSGENHAGKCKILGSIFSTLPYTQVWFKMATDDNSYLCLILFPLTFELLQFDIYKPSDWHQAWTCHVIALSSLAQSYALCVFETAVNKIPQYFKQVYFMVSLFAKILNILESSLWHVDIRTIIHYTEDLKIRGSDRVCMLFLIALIQKR
jgi:hypothetical protein